MKAVVIIMCIVLYVTDASAQVITDDFLPISDADPQPLLAHATRVDEALAAIGSALPSEARARLSALKNEGLSFETVREIQAILDPYCIAKVTINPEARVMVNEGPAKPVLIQDGWTNFLVKIHNQGKVTSRLEVTSPNAKPILHISSNAPRVLPKNELTKGDLDNRFLELLLYRDRPMKPQLSGQVLEYVILQVYTRHQGKREARLGFHVGHGTEDLGFRNTIDILFDIKPSVKVVFNIKDHDGSPTMASLLIRDDIERLRSPSTTGLSLRENAIGISPCGYRAICSNTIPFFNLSNASGESTHCQRADPRLRMSTPTSFFNRRFIGPTVNMCICHRAHT
jgi:hypothetical protein